MGGAEETIGLGGAPAKPAAPRVTSSLPLIRKRSTANRISVATSQAPGRNQKLLVSGLAPRITFARDSIGVTTQKPAAPPNAILPAVERAEAPSKANSASKIAMSPAVADPAGPEPRTAAPRTAAIKISDSKRLEFTNNLPKRKDFKTLLKIISKPSDHSVWKAIMWSSY